MNIKWIGLLSIVTSIAAYGCSSNPQQTDFGLGNGDDSGSTTSSSSSGSSSGSSSSAGTSSGNNTSSSNGGGSGSGASSGNTGTSSGSNGGGSGGSSSGVSSGGASGSSSGSGNCTSDAGSDPDTDYCTPPVTLTMTPFTVQPGGEVYYCQNFANPWGKQVDIKTYDLNMSTGSHHMFAFYANGGATGANANGPNTMCANGGLTFGAYTFSAQSAKATSTFPQSVGATIPSNTGFMINVHYINTGATALTANVALKMWIAKSGVVTNHAGALFLNQAAMYVPATGCTTAPGCPSSSTYTLPQDINIMWADSHMHQFATGFTATTNTGVTIFSTTEWQEPPAKTYNPPLHLAAGTVITWTCTDVNTTGAMLTFGEHAQSNVMCISSNGFYPVSDPTNPVLGTQL